MIIQSVIMHNFGVFRGRHEIGFQPSSPERPIVLIGAMNGSGKTTLLEALKLALFGRRATDVSRGSRSYEEFLAESVNRDVALSDGAAVEVVFTLLTGGKDCTYRIVRSWSGAHGLARESFEVYVDSIYDPVLSDGWNEHVESILPVRLAPFFFFDGERLETLADVSKAREFLANAIEALLGLDIVERLSDDLRSVERRVKEGAVDAPKDQEELLKLRAQTEVHDQEVSHLMQRCGELTNVLEQAKRAKDQARRELDAISGDLPQRTLALQKEHASFIARRADAMSKLMAIAYEIGPLILVQGALQHALDEASPSDLEPALLAERDRRVISAMKRKRVPAGVLSSIEAVFAADLAQRSAKSTNSSGVSRALLSEVLQDTRHADGAAQEAISMLETCDIELMRIDAQLVALPTPQSLEPLKENVRQRESASTLAEAEYRLATEALDRARKQRERVEGRIQEVFALAMEHAKQQRYATKLVARSGEFRKTLESFRSRMAARHATSLGESILEAFQCLHRKEGTIERIVVDTRAFDMTLYDESGRRVDPARLSAGERQLLAVAMVWAILKAAGRPLPLWIDTPLGRLDSVHRRHLVERFFPFAAPQVVLLSTDTEIDDRARELLLPYVSKSYRIDFDPDSRTSVCSEGYFLERVA